MQTTCATGQRQGREGIQSYSSHKGVPTSGSTKESVPAIDTELVQTPSPQPKTTRPTRQCQGREGTCVFLFYIYSSHVHNFQHKAHRIM